MKRFSLFAAVLLVAACQSEAPDLKLNDLGYFERQGVNVLVFSNPFSGGFNDEKDSAIRSAADSMTRRTPASRWSTTVCGPSRAAPSA